MKMPSAPKMPLSKPHIRMRHLHPVAPSAFPTGAAAFPASPGDPTSSGAISAPPGGMPSGAAGGDMGE